MWQLRHTGIHVSTGSQRLSPRARSDRPAKSKSKHTHTRAESFRRKRLFCVLNPRPAKPRGGRTRSAPPSRVLRRTHGRTAGAALGKRSQTTPGAGSPPGATEFVGYGDFTVSALISLLKLFSGLDCLKDKQRGILLAYSDFFLAPTSLSHATTTTSWN